MTIVSLAFYRAMERTDGNGEHRSADRVEGGSVEPVVSIQNLGAVEHRDEHGDSVYGR